MSNNNENENDVDKLELVFKAIVSIAKTQERLALRIAAIEQIMPHIHEFIDRTEADVEQIANKLENQSDDDPADYWKRGQEPPA